MLFNDAQQAPQTSFNRILTSVILLPIAAFIALVDEQGMNKGARRHFVVGNYDFGLFRWWDVPVMKSVCVFCGSSDAVAAEYLAAARQMGQVLARRSLRLVYGGGRTGLMGAVANGALEAGGEVIGVMIPSMHTAELAHPSLTRMDIVPEMHARKARMHELSDGYIALPGGFGTFDELFETVTWGQIGAHEKPIGLLNVNDYYVPLLAAIDHAVREGFVLLEHREALHCEADPEKLLHLMEKHRHPSEAVKRWLHQREE
jgi:hypothetical protein